MVRYLAIACFLICSQGSTRAVQKDKDAVVYVYRYRQLIGRFVAPVIYCDGEPLAHMQNGRYFSVRVAPGRHLFQAEDKQAVVPIHAKPGGAYFIRIWNIQTTKGMVLRIDPDQGRAELSTGLIKPLDKKKVIDHDSVSIKKVDFAAKDSLSYSFKISAQAARTSPRRP